MAKRVDVKKINNTNKFREQALNFERCGYYTASPKGTTAWREYWDQETKRCLYGYTAEDDDHITGYFYFYLNFCRIVLVKEKEILDSKTKRTRKVTIREKSFPSFYDYDKVYFDIVEEAENAGKHLAVIKCRRRGYSYKNASMLCRNFYLIPDSKSYAVAAEQEYLLKDGILTKAWDMMDFVDEHTAWAKKKQKVNTKMHKRASLVIDKNGVKAELGYKSEIIGVSLKNDVQKIRGKCFGRGTRVIMSDGRFKNVENIIVGDRLMGPDGKARNVLEIHSGTDNLYKISPVNGVDQIVNSSHEIFYDYRKWDFKTSEYKLDTPEFFIDSEQTTLKPRSSLVKVDGIDFSERDLLINPYILGLWLGDGSQGKTEFTSADCEIIDYIHRFADLNGLLFKTGHLVNNKAITLRLSRRKGIFTNWFKDELRRLNIFNNKDIPEDYIYNSYQRRLELLAGLIDTDGYYDEKYHRFEIIQKRKNIADKIVFVARSLGIKTSIGEKYVKGYTDVYWRVNLLSKLEEIPTLISRKKANYYKKYDLDLLKTRFDVSCYGTGEYYGFTLDKDHLFLLEDFTVCHNSGKVILFEEAGKFRDLKEAWQIARPSVEQDSQVYGILICFGTGGTDEANYEGLKEIFYEPEAYNCLEIENSWDDGASDSTCGFFVPEYYNMTGDEEKGLIFMDQDGNSLIEPAKKYCLSKRETIYTKASDKLSIDRYISEHPFCPVEATLQISGNIFPKKDLIRHLAYIRNTESMRTFKQVGTLEFDVNGKIVWEIDPKLRDHIKYRLEPGVDKKGAIVIWEHPVEDPPYGLYIFGIDPYDFDQSTTTSLGSCIVYKRFQNFESYYDLPVAEYTGRPDTAEEYYENVRMLLMYYGGTALYENEKKGLFAYFSHKHSEYLLADQPDIIKDIIKDSRVQRGKGIHMNIAIKDWGELLIRDWLNEEYAPGKKNLTKIFSEPLLEELISYYQDGNFDRVIAFMMVMIYRQELHHVIVKNKQREDRSRMIFPDGIFMKDNNRFAI